MKRNYVPGIDLHGIALKDLNGSTLTAADFTGKPLIVNFWGTWCGPCRQELPVFQKAREKYGTKISFLMISDEPAGKIIKFKEENLYTFVYAQSQTRFRELGITSVPVTCFYDANGNLIAKKKDPLNEEELNTFISGLIKP